jgi:Xaa-Pro aminopeptidase
MYAVEMSTVQTPILLFGESYHHPNIFYRSGFLVPDPVVLVDQHDRTTLWTSALEEGRARKEARVDEVRSSEELGLSEMLLKAGSEQNAWSLLLQAVCREHGIEAVDVDSDFPAIYADHLRNADVDVRPRTDLYRRERRIKTAQEVEWIAETENAGMEGLQRAIDLIAAADIRDGILWHQGRPLSGDDLILAVESRLLELGCTTNGSICAGGPESADPHRSTSEVLRAGLPIVLDIFPFHKTTRYWGDMTRTVVRGTPPPEVERMWDAVREAQQLGLDMVKPGINGRDIHYAICDVFKKRGYGSLAAPYRDIQSDARFIHGTGHGLGLEIHEFPRVSEVDIVLEVGDVVTIEPGLYDPRLGGIRIEDLVVVTEDGCRNLTTLPKVFRLD